MVAVLDPRPLLSVLVLLLKTKTSTSCPYTQNDDINPPHGNVATSRISDTGSVCDHAPFIRQAIFQHRSTTDTAETGP